MEYRTVKCACGAEFSVPVKRGRPRSRCADCDAALAEGNLRDRLASLGADVSKMDSKGIVPRPRSTKHRPENGPQSEDRAANINESNTKSRADWIVDNLETSLKARGTHISQHRDKWWT